MWIVIGPIEIVPLCGEGIEPTSTPSIGLILPVERALRSA
jgi:hypothetical protein